MMLLERMGRSDVWGVLVRSVLRFLKSPVQILPLHRVSPRSYCGLPSARDATIHERCDIASGGSSSQLLLRCSRPIENGGYSNEQEVSWSSEKIAVMSTIYQQRLGVSVGKPD